MTTGSSPLARGGRRHHLRAARRDRLIPARAGRTPTSATVATSTPAHPRSRGADPTGVQPLVCGPGSSPLARGGPTSTLWAVWTCRAHPRSRGADPVAACTPPGPAGSSPLARGGPPGTTRTRNDPGLIPARAGRTHLSRPAPSRGRAHPRSRGADRAGTCGGSWSAGSSPLARGGLEVATVADVGLRLIPARAGRTRRRT